MKLLAQDINFHIKSLPVSKIFILASLRLGKRFRNFSRTYVRTYEKNVDRFVTIDLQLGRMHEYSYTTVRTDKISIPTICLNKW